MTINSLDVAPISRREREQWEQYYRQQQEQQQGQQLEVQQLDEKTLKKKAKAEKNVAKTQKKAEKAQLKAEKAKKSPEGRGKGSEGTGEVHAADSERGICHVRPDRRHRSGARRSCRRDRKHAHRHRPERLRFSSGMLRLSVALSPHSQHEVKGSSKPDASLS